MRSVRWSRRALQDYDQLTEYYLAIDEELSADIGRKIVAKAHWLLEFPSVGTPVDGRTVRKSGVAGTPYLILYRPLHDGIRVDRLFHERQRWRR